jgi:hypothetical protein
VGTGGTDGVDPAGCGDGFEPWLNYGIGKGGSWYGGVYRVWDAYSAVNEPTGTDFAPVCLSGTLAPSDPGTETWTFVQVGWSIQETYDEFCYATMQEISISDYGIELNYDNFSLDDSSFVQRDLRVDLYNGFTGEVWGVNLFQTSGVEIIPIDAFVKDCFDPESQAPYAGELVTNINVQIPGEPAASATIDFCVYSIQPVHF